MSTLHFCHSPADSVRTESAPSGAAGHATAGAAPADFGSLIGEPVYNHLDEYLGLILEIMLDMESGKNSHAVVTQGAAFHESGRMVAVPWQALAQGSGGRFTLRVDKQIFDAAPGFDYASWPDMDDAVWSPHAFMQDGAKAWRLL